VGFSALIEQWKSPNPLSLQVLEEMKIDICGLEVDCGPETTLGGGDF